MNNEINLRSKVYYRGVEYVVMSKHFSGSKFVGYTIGKTRSDVENCFTVKGEELYLIGDNKPLDDFIKKVMNKKFGGRRFYVSVEDGMLRIAYHTTNGGEENVEVPYKNLSNLEIAEFLLNEYTNYDVNTETYNWLDETGHGKDGAPHNISDILADKKEWEKCLDWLSTAAGKLRV